MTLAELLEELGRRGVTLAVRDGGLAVRGSRERLDDVLVGELRTHRDRLIEVLREERGAEAGPELVAGARSGGAPVVPSPAQRRFWDLHRLTPEPSVLNVPGAFRFTGPLDVAALRTALDAFVERHEILRSRFSDGPDGPVITFAEPGGVELPVEVLDLPEEGRDELLNEILEAASDVPLDLEVGPPFRAHLYRLAEGDHALLFIAHSLVWDGWSFDLLLRDLAAFYEEAIGGAGQGAPPELPLQYADVAAWQTRAAESEAARRDLEFWRKQLEGPIPSLDLPRREAPAPSAGYRGARSWFVLDGELIEGVRSLARETRTTPYAVFLAGFTALLHRYTRTRDVMVATPFYGRNRTEFENIVGVFANTLFLRTEVDETAPFRALVEQVHENTVAAGEHQAAPTGRVASLLQDARGSRAPYEALFVFQQTARRPTRFGSVEVRAIRHGTRRVAVDLVVWVREYAEYADGAFNFRTALFSPETIEAMKSHFVHLLREAVRAPHAAVEELRLAGEAERARATAWSVTRRSELLRVIEGRVEVGEREVALLDPGGHPVPANVPGEVRIESDDDPSGWTGAGVYGRWTTEGRLRVVEDTSGESEVRQASERLAGHADVSEAVLVRQPTGAGELRSVAYVVWATDLTPFDSELRRWMSESCPAEFVPAVVVSLDALPRDPAGAVDEAELPNPFGARDAGPTGNTLESDTERAIADIWRDFLDVEEIGPYDNFFELGGHSLLAVEAVARIEQRFGTRIVARDTFFLTLRRIAEDLDAATRPASA